MTHAYFCFLLTEYSNESAACQVGNLAYRQKALLSYQHHTEAIIYPVTAGDIQHDFSTIQFDESHHLFIVQLRRFKIF